MMWYTTAGHPIGDYPTGCCLTRRQFHNKPVLQAHVFWSRRVRLSGPGYLETAVWGLSMYAVGRRGAIAVSPVPVSLCRHFNKSIVFAWHGLVDYETDDGLSIYTQLILTFTL